MHGLTAAQITAIGAVLSPVVVGIVALAGFRHDSRERTQERNREFQRDAIIALQESAWELRQVMVDMLDHARKLYVASWSAPNENPALVTKGAWPDIEHMLSRFRSGEIRMLICESRVWDESLREQSMTLRAYADLIEDQYRTALEDEIDSITTDGVEKLERATNTCFDLYSPFNDAASKALRDLIPKQ